MELTKHIGETPLSYHKRIVYGKLVDKTLADADYSELAELVYGKPYSSDVARRMFYGSKHTLDLIGQESVAKLDSQDLVDELNKKMWELQKERIRLSDQRAAFNKVVRARARQEELNDIIKKAISESNLPELHYVPPVYLESTFAPERDCPDTMLISLNDIHYGLVVNNNWCKYSPEICAKMFETYFNKIVEIGLIHGITNVYVYNCGDSISGNIHTPIQLANKENVIRQVMGVSELIATFLSELSHQFEYVGYLSVAGNHSRLAKKEDAPYDERADDLIEWYLQARLNNFENVHFLTSNRIDETVSSFDLYGKTYVIVHGDFDGSPTKIASLQQMIGSDIYAVLLGHKHHNSYNSENGIKTVMSGSFVGMDDYCVQKRIVGQPEQTVCLCDDTGIVCHYDVTLLE